jgi:hypothetical protein
LRGVAAVGACLLALASTGAMVTAAVVSHTGSGPAVVLTPHDNGNGNINGNGNSNGKGDGHGSFTGGDLSAILAKLKAEQTKSPKPTPKPVPHTKPAPHPEPASHSSTTTHPVHPQTPAPTPKVVVDSSDPAPFSAQAVAASEAARVLPVESLGPLSGVSFGSGLFIWPVLLAVDVFALAVIARMALRRRLVAPEE